GEGAAFFHTSDHFIHRAGGFAADCLRREHISNNDVSPHHVAVEGSLALRVLTLDECSLGTHDARQHDVAAFLLRPGPGDFEDKGCPIVEPHEATGKVFHVESLLGGLCTDLADVVVCHPAYGYRLGRAHQPHCEVNPVHAQINQRPAAREFLLA